MRERGVDTKPYLPAIHLMSFYRERFGHREGEFPVCEDVARRSMALPFFPELSDGEVEQVVGALREVIAGALVGEPADGAIAGPYAPDRRRQLLAGPPARDPVEPWPAAARGAGPGSARGFRLAIRARSEWL